MAREFSASTVIDRPVDEMSAQRIKSAVEAS
jgi:hypothetical protein